MKIQVIISCLAVLFAFNQTFAQTTFNPSMYDTYSINSPFTAYDITNKHGTGIAEMGSIPYNQWVFEKVSDNTFYIKEVKTGKYLHIQNAGIEVGDIEKGWWSAQWELEHVNGNYYRIKCKWHKYGAPLYLQNPQRTLSIGELADKSAKYGMWRVRKDGQADLPPDEEVNQIPAKPDYIITFRNESLYIAKYTLTFKIPGKLPGQLSSGEIIIGEKASFTVPAQATEIQVKGEGMTGLAWEFWRTTFDLTYQAQDMCVQSEGTSLHQTYATNCQVDK